MQGQAQTQTSAASGPKCKKRCSRLKPVPRSLNSSQNFDPPMVHCAFNLVSCVQRCFNSKNYFYFSVISINNYNI